MATGARYDSHADWYDAWSRGDAAPVMAVARSTLLELLPPGDGVVVDLGCGTGLPAADVASSERPVLAVDLSADQARSASASTTARSTICWRPSSGLMRSWTASWNGATARSRRCSPPG